MLKKNWKTRAYKVVFITALLAIFVGGSAVGQMVVKANPAVNQTTNQYNATVNQAS
jgi:hypothetical protein